jgi:hypothetical protein
MAERRSWGVDFNQGFSRSRRLSKGRLVTVFSIGMGDFQNTSILAPDHFSN